MLLDHLNSLLDDAAPVHLQRELQYVSHQMVRQHAPLVQGAMLEEALDNVVAEYIHNELCDVLNDFLEYELFLLVTGGLELLLYESASVLVLTELHYVVLEFPQLYLPVLAPEVFQQLALVAASVLGLLHVRTCPPLVVLLLPLHVGHLAARVGVEVAGGLPGVVRGDTHVLVRRLLHVVVRPALPHVLVLS